MAAVAYKYYRLFVLEGVASAYVTINEFALYETVNITSSNLAIGATATASSVYSSFVAKNAIDGKDATYWESGATVGGDWLKVDLPVAKVVRSFNIKSIMANGEAPKSFRLEASNNNTSWVVLYEKTDNAAEIFHTPFSISVSGVSKLDTSVRSLRVYVHRWDNGELVGNITPQTDGSWAQSVIDTADVMVTHIGPSGYAPRVDGPITPYSW